MARIVNGERVPSCIPFQEALIASVREDRSPFGMSESYHIALLQIKLHIMLELEWMLGRGNEQRHGGCGDPRSLLGRFVFAQPRGQTRGVLESSGSSNSFTSAHVHSGVGCQQGFTM
jgi:hypothetical protein